MKKLVVLHLTYIIFFSSVTLGGECEKDTSRNSVQCLETKLQAILHQLNEQGKRIKLIDEKQEYLENILEKTKYSQITADMEGNYKLPDTPKEGKPFIPPLNKTIALCDEPFYFTYHGFKASRVEYVVSYRSYNTHKLDKPGAMNKFGGNKYTLTLRYMQLSDSGDNPIYIFECAEK